MSWRKACFLSLAAFLLPSLVWAQSVRYQSIAVSSRGTPLANQNVAVCGQPANTNTQPCSPLASLYVDLTHQSYSIATSTGAVRSSGIVTITTTAANSISLGQTVSISGVADATFNGTFTVQSSGGSQFSYAQAGANATSGGGSVNAANPATTDVNGNFFFYAVPGRYTVQIYGPSVQTPFVQPDTVLACDPTGSCTFTGSNSFSQPIVSTVATGTAPFSIASTTVVPNLNAQLHNGLTTPASAIVGISDTQTLTNKTLTSASNGNSVTLLCSSGPAAAITGNSSAQTFESCTIPANAVANLKALRVTAVWSHSTGSAVVTYGMTLNGVALWPTNNTASTANGISQSALIIETASTTGNVLTPQGFFSLTANSLTGLSWTAGQTLAVTFNVANTDQVTPLFFLVELIQ